MNLETHIKQGRLDPAMTFSQRVLAVTARIPRGKVTSYGTIAAALGNPKAARAVGMALHVNPYAPDVPCHRVIGSDGKLTGFASGIRRKAQLLRKEGVEVWDGRIADRDIFLTATQLNAAPLRRCR